MIYNETATGGIVLSGIAANVKKRLQIENCLLLFLNDIAPVYWGKVPAKGATTAIYAERVTGGEVLNQQRIDLQDDAEFKLVIRSNNLDTACWTANMVRKRLDGFQGDLQGIACYGARLQTESTTGVLEPGSDNRQFGYTQQYKIRHTILNTV